MSTNPVNPLMKVNQLGQSIWLDFISREILHNGELQRLIDEDSLQGMTSNPAIFEKAMTGSAEYDADIRTLAQQGKSTKEIYEAMAVADVQLACDKFRSVYDKPEGNRTDGYVSLEVAPDLVHDTAGTVEEGRRLWQAVNRPNLMIKVPGTTEGLPAIRTLLSEGINVNVTLLFSVERYQQVVETFLAALEDRVKAGQPVAGIASVASFFLSRIDLLLDPKLEQIIQSGGEKAAAARPLLGQIAIASAKQAYQFYQETFASERFQRLAERGAGSQRLLWASTGNKNPAYSPLKYVEALIGPPHRQYRTPGDPASLPAGRTAETCLAGRPFGIRASPESIANGRPRPESRRHATGNRGSQEVCGSFYPVDGGTGEEAAGSIEPTDTRVGTSRNRQKLNRLVTEDP